MRESWTDERLDDFRAETARRFDEVDRRFDEADKRFAGLERRLERLAGEMNSRFDSLQRTQIVTQAAFITGLLGLLATRL